ncbi:MAG: hypothetical protein HS116_21075 [Planctomycetes bacterium]|nr:hypothetical protein [Planctomycetota bacterium]
MSQPETLSMQAARKLLGEVLGDYDEAHVIRAAEILAPYFPPEGDRPQVVVILEGGNVSSAHSNVPGLDFGIIDLDEEADFNRRIAQGESEADAMDEVVHDKMQEHRANLDAGRLPHLAY